MDQAFQPALLDPVEPHMIHRIPIALVGLLLTLPLHAAQPPADRVSLSFIPDGQSYRFDTGILRGTLRKDGKSLGLLPVIHTPSGKTIARSVGLFGHYRLLDDAHRYGPAGWDWSSQSRLLPDGSVQTQWSADKDHPFDMTAVYRWSAPDTLDLTTTITPRQDLRRFEAFLASYFEGFAESFVYAKPPAAANASFIPAEQSAGDWQMFPRDDEAVKIITDGRWKREPNPVDWTLMPRLEGALAMRRDRPSGLTALVMAVPEDCFAVATPHAEEGHRSLYLCLLGRDLKAGQPTAARSRLVIAKDLSDQQALALYQAYLKDLNPPSR
jgi:hypothetical protein